METVMIIIGVYIIYILIILCINFTILLIQVYIKTYFLSLEDIKNKYLYQMFEQE